jgi:peptide/nickel transport system permease protein
LTVAGTASELPGPVATRRQRRGLFRRYVLPRLVTLLLLSAITFAATDALGIDAARQALGRNVTEEQLASFRAQHGLDRPLVVRYGDWLSGFVQGDWGESAVTGRPVRDEIGLRLGYTLLLSLAALVLSIPLALLLGVYGAKRAHTARDIGLSTGSVVLAAMPIFVLGIVLILVFGVYLEWLPVASTALSFGTPLEKVLAFVLPAVTLALAIAPHVLRMTRAAFRETLAAPYAQSAVLRGLPPRQLTWHYLMPNAAAPIVNVIALNIMWLLGGVIIVEDVFAFPGLGQILLDNIRVGDLAGVQAIAMVTGVMFITITLIADLLVVFFNPRLRAELR